MRDGAKLTRNKSHANAHGVWLDTNTFEFVGNVTNITGGFNVDDLGSMRKLARSVNRSEFLADFVGCMRSIYALNDGQAKLLKYMMADTRFFSKFRWDADAKSELARATGLSPSSVGEYFGAMVAQKRLLIRLRSGWYRLNPELVFHPNEVKNADFLSINLTFKFEKEQDVVISEKPRVTLEMLDTLTKMYREQVAQEQKFKNMQIDEEAS